jgi:hypothetical protein
MLDLNKLCNEQIAKSEVAIYRYYDYEFEPNTAEETTDYISIMFNDLSNVKAFQQWTKENFGVRIDMAQIEAKENFYDFNFLAIILCIAIILISILFVIIFLYSLINAHFQKISKNLGTIMAFGLDNRSIIRIYLTVFMGLIIVGLAIATTLLLAFQKLSEFAGIVRTVNGTAIPYVNMLDPLVLGVLGGILLLSVIVTYIVMKGKLKATPGDLIFERNN